MLSRALLLLGAWPGGLCPPSIRGATTGVQKGNDKRLPSTRPCFCWLLLLFIFAVLILVSVCSLCKYASHYLAHMQLILLNRLLLLQLRAAYYLWGRTASSEQASDRLRIANLLDFGVSVFINVVVLNVHRCQCLVVLMSIVL